jgi:hypothetical protein
MGPNPHRSAISETDSKQRTLGLFFEMYDPRGTISGERELSARSCRSNRILSFRAESRNLLLSPSMSKAVNANSERCLPPFDCAQGRTFGRDDRAAPSQAPRVITTRFGPIIPDKREKCGALLHNCFASSTMRWKALFLEISRGQLHSGDQESNQSKI